MSNEVRLRTKSDTVINFTDRVDINSSHILFEISERDDRTFRYRITLRTWAKLAPKVTPRLNMTLLFERGGEPAQRVDVGNARTIINSGGVVTGTIDGGFDPSSLGLKIIISDPSRDHIIVVSGSKGKPDIDDAEIDDNDDQKATPERISRIRQSSGSANGLINVYEQDDISSSWGLKLKNVECPHLVVSPKIGKLALTSDVRTQWLVFPEVFRRITTELVMHPGVYESEPWVKPWQKFAASFSGIGEWSYFSGDDDDPDLELVHARVDEAVRRYCSTVLTPINDATATC